MGQKKRAGEFLRRMTPEERAKYKRTPAEKAEAAEARDRRQEAGAEYIREMYKKKIKKKTGGKVSSKKKVKKGGAPHNRLY